MLRSALCVAMLVICLVASQCTASDPNVAPPASATNAPAGAGAEVSGGGGGGQVLLGASVLPGDSGPSGPLGDVDGAASPDGTGSDEDKGDKDVAEREAVEEQVGELGKVGQVGKEVVNDGGKSSPPPNSHGTVGGTGACGGLGNAGGIDPSSSSTSTLTSNPAGGAAGSLGASGAAISHGGDEESGDPPSGRPQGGTGVNTATRETKTGTPNGQAKGQSTDVPGASSGHKGDAPASKQPTTERETAAKPKESQTTAPATSVKLLNSTTSTAAPADSTQTSVTSTTKSAKWESIAPGNTLPKLSKTLQSVDQKNDGSIGSSSLFAFTALATLVVMVVVPTF